METQVVTIPKKLSKGEDLVVIKSSDFKVFQEWQKNIREALEKVERGRKEYQQKKTIIASSPKVFR